MERVLLYRNPLGTLLERIKRKDPPGVHKYSENYILCFNDGIGLSLDYEEAKEYRLNNSTPFPVGATQEIPNQPNTTARLMIINPEVFETIVDIGAAANRLQKLRLVDVVHSRRAGSLRSVRIEKSQRFEKAPWHTVRME